MSGLLCTSLAPFNLTLQQAAVASWQEAGFAVRSLNCRDEIDELESHFKEVDFVEAPRDARALHGKPLVYLDDVLSALREEQYLLKGIVNSDIVFREPNLCDMLLLQLRGSVGFGNRLDVQTMEDQTGSPYELGYDFFFFDSGMLEAIPQSRFCLGMPWWDYWFPLAALLTGNRLQYLSAPIAFHQIHETHWENQFFYDYGRHCKTLLQPSPLQQKLERFGFSHFSRDYLHGKGLEEEDIVAALDCDNLEKKTFPVFAATLCAFVRESGTNFQQSESSSNTAS